MTVPGAAIWDMMLSDDDLDVSHVIGRVIGLY